MARVEIIMPQLGESIAEGTVVKWLKAPGDKVGKDESVLEITTDKVRISSNKAWGTRPSMICTDATPLFAASSADAILGNMPPDKVPSANIASISRAERSVSRLPALSSTPGVLVSSSSFSATAGGPSSGGSAIGTGPDCSAASHDCVGVAAAGAVTVLIPASP